MEDTYQQHKAILRGLYDRHAVVKVTNTEYCEILLDGEVVSRDGILFCVFTEGDFETTIRLRDVQR